MKRRQKGVANSPSSSSLSPFSLTDSGASARSDASPRSDISEGDITAENETLYSRLLSMPLADFEAEVMKTDYSRVSVFAGRTLAHHLLLRICRSGKDLEGQKDLLEKFKILALWTDPDGKTRSEGVSLVDFIARNPAAHSQVRGVLPDILASVRIRAAALKDRMNDASEHVHDALFELGKTMPQSQASLVPSTCDITDISTICWSLCAENAQILHTQRYQSTDLNQKVCGLMLRYPAEKIAKNVYKWFSQFDPRQRLAALYVLEQLILEVMDSSTLNKISLCYLPSSEQYKPVTDKLIELIKIKEEHVRHPVEARYCRLQEAVLDVGQSFQELLHSWLAEENAGQRQRLTCQIYSEIHTLLSLWYLKIPESEFPHWKDSANPLAPQKQICTQYFSHLLNYFIYTLITSTPEIRQSLVTLLIALGTQAVADVKGQAKSYAVMLLSVTALGTPVITRLRPFEHLTKKESKQCNALRSMLATPQAIWATMGCSDVIQSITAFGGSCIKANDIGNPIDRASVLGALVTRFRFGRQLVLQGKPLQCATDIRSFVLKYEPVDDDRLYELSTQVLPSVQQQPADRSSSVSRIGKFKERTKERAAMNKTGSSSYPGMKPQ